MSKYILFICSVIHAMHSYIIGYMGRDGQEFLWSKEQTGLNALIYFITLFSFIINRSAIIIKVHHGVI